MLKFIKKEIVLITAALFAAITMFVVPPNTKYIDYIDFSVLAILFCLMAVVAGFIRSGLFDYMSYKLLDKTDSVKIISAVLTGLCFFSAMLITNDVALITFVPLTITVLRGISQKGLIFIITLETVAANLGSMLTPIGNPQNLYIYSFYNMDLQEFIGIVFPVCAVSFILITVTLAFGGKKHVDREHINPKRINKKLLVLYFCLFILSAVTVLRIVDYKICFIFTAVSLLVLDRKVLTKVDYSLLGTFLAFFIFVGNLGNITIIKETLSDIVTGREFITGVAASQIISNVPAAVMLSGFTANARELLLGVNVGGLGTLVASLASLISYKLYIKIENAKPLLYLGIFTAVNIFMLAILVGFTMICI